ncbi:type III-B CRISPR-associated protein Cas10/Cmr2 [Dapis sp. BLCC M172]|uniref:type III-B CRISPR-associated protein Cas10/Cmr2 n=1 Tax=Dapis sp. BLCC M172 TaxID=2975281 RepID=UPI003CFB5A91
MLEKIYKGIAWCLAWGNEKELKFDIPTFEKLSNSTLEKMSHPTEENEIAEKLENIINKVQKLQDIDNYFPEKITDLKNEKYKELWDEETPIGLVYGGATKIKQYVFEAAKLTDIRGASAILDKINLVDLKEFFQPDTKSRKWLDEERNFPGLSQALIHELIIYSTGGNILAFCPAAFVDDLANAIEKRYTEETLTANSCAVGSTFRLLEIRFGLLRENIVNTPWLDWYLENCRDKLVESYFGLIKGKTKEEVEKEIRENFQNRKSFNELTSKLATLFNQRRNGNDDVNNNRPSRRYPPMFETHPYMRRDEGDRRIAVAQVDLPNNPYYSEVLARKHLVGQKTKRDSRQSWYEKAGFTWQPDTANDLYFLVISKLLNEQYFRLLKFYFFILVQERQYLKSWGTKFEEFLAEPKNQELAKKYNPKYRRLQTARSLRELGNVYKGFIAYIYADGNNMGGYIQKIKTPEKYKKFSQDIFDATEKSVYFALAEHLHPHQLKNLTDPDNENRNEHWIHPFEILAIGGDDVMLIVPANKALEIAKTIGEKFEEILAEKTGYEPANSESTYDAKKIHRYLKEAANENELSLSDSTKYTPIYYENKSSLSMSTGVLITAENTPVYYAQNLTDQLLKSAKKRAKKLKEKNYLGGTIDFLSLKSVTMVSSNIQEFREQGLIKEIEGKLKTKPTKLKLYAAPYTLHEIGGLIESVKALKESKFPRSQIYQTRSFLEKGKKTAILNYRYFRCRLQTPENKRVLEEKFEQPWCAAKTNNGNLAPWISQVEDQENSEDKKEKKSEAKEETTYETIWREIVDIYDFIEVETETEKKNNLVCWVQEQNPTKPY